MDPYFHRIQRPPTLTHAQPGFAYDVAPGQYYSPKELYAARGEVTLRYAVLEDALECFHKQFVADTREARRLAREAEAWFFTDDPHWPFSFVNICTALELDPETTRRRLRHWRQHPPAGPRRGRRHLLPARRPITVAA